MAWIFSLVLLTACGREALSYPAELAPYVQSFLEGPGKGADTSGVRIEYTDYIREGIAGMCRIDGTIQLSRYYWRADSESYKTALIWHEMGHCVLNLGHNDTRVDGCPDYMSTYLNPYCFAKKYMGGKGLVRLVYEIVDELGCGD